MSLLHWFTRNWAETGTPGDPDLAPAELPLLPGPALEFVADRLRSLPRWRIEAVDPSAGTLHATHRTLVFRFVDDVHVRVEPAPTGSRVHARSRSRIGKGDLGQNRRNLRMLLRALQTDRKSEAGKTDS